MDGTELGPLISPAYNAASLLLSIDLDSNSFTALDSR